MVDTLVIYKNLIAAGLNSKQAEAIARAIYLAHMARSNVAVTEPTGDRRMAALLGIADCPDLGNIVDKLPRFIAASHL